MTLDPVQENFSLMDLKPSTTKVKMGNLRRIVLEREDGTKVYIEGPQKVILTIVEEVSPQCIGGRYVTKASINIEGVKEVGFEEKQ